MTEENSQLVKSLEFNPIQLPDWYDVQIEQAEEDGITYRRKKGKEIIYKKNEDGWQCVQCGSKVMAGRIAHSEWIKGMHGAGTGNVKNEEVPYCPKCEEEPKLHGSPYYIPL